MRRKEDDKFRSYFWIGLLFGFVLGVMVYISGSSILSLKRMIP